MYCNTRPVIVCKLPVGVVVGKVGNDVDPDTGILSVETIIDGVVVVVADGNILTCI